MRLLEKVVRILKHPKMTMIAPSTHLHLPAILFLLLIGFSTSLQSQFRHFIVSGDFGVDKTIQSYVLPLSDDRGHRTCPQCGAAITDTEFECGLYPFCRLAGGLAKEEGSDYCVFHSSIFIQVFKKEE